jgi:hypothetical protein
LLRQPDLAHATFADFQQQVVAADRAFPNVRRRKSYRARQTGGVQLSIYRQKCPEFVQQPGITLASVLQESLTLCCRLLQRGLEQFEYTSMAFRL